MQIFTRRRRVHVRWCLHRAKLAWSALSLMLVFAACRSDSVGPSGTQPFVIRVDSLVASPARVSDTLSVTYHGVIGSSLCYQLDRVEESQGPDSVMVVFHGLRQLGIPCEQTFAVLSSVRRYPPPRNASFTIVVRQPDGSFLRKMVLGI